MTKEIRLRKQDGAMQTISPSAFFRIFGVAYSPNLRFRSGTPPKEFVDQCAIHAAGFNNGINGRKLAAYKRKIRAGYVVPSYIAKVSDEVGHGLYAGRDIEPDEMIGEYTGMLSGDWVPNPKSARDFNPYLFKYPFDCAYAVDAGKYGNEMRFVNHSSKHKNVRRVYAYLERILHVIFVADRLIPKDAQILLDYGKQYWHTRIPTKL